MSTRRDRVEDNPLFQVDVVEKEWAKEVKAYMDDEDLSKTIDLVMKLIVDPNVPQSKVAVVCTQLEAWAIKFRMEYVAFMSYKKGTDEANMKKNHYKELYTGIDRLVDSLKYLAR